VSLSWSGSLSLLWTLSGRWFRGDLNLKRGLRWLLVY